MNNISILNLSHINSFSYRNHIPPSKGNSSDKEELFEIKRRKTKKTFSHTVKNNQPAWTNKKPVIFDGTFFFESKPYRVEKIGTGSFHNTYRFTGQETMEINGEALAVSELVLKTLSGSLGPNKVVPTAENDVNGYNYLKKHDIPVAHAYIEPSTFIDRSNPHNGLFWIVEKMDEEISGKEWKECKSFDKLDPTSKRVLNFAKKWLTHMAKEEKDVINDFRKRNTMLKQGEIKIVDPGLPETDKEDIKGLIKTYTNDWANSNRTIFDWLCEDFPEEMKPKFKPKI